MVGLATSILVDNPGYAYSTKICIDAPCVICTLLSLLEPPRLQKTAHHNISYYYIDQKNHDNL